MKGYQKDYRIIFTERARLPNLLLKDISTLNHEEAKKVLVQALKINPKNANTYFNLGIIYSSKNLPKTAIRYFKQALNFGGNNANIYYNL